MLIPLFPPNLDDALERVRAINPKDYASSRNFLAGAVTKISPYVTHGFINLADVAAEIESNYPAEECEKLIMEFGWREFFQHVWRHKGDHILRDLKPGLPGIKYLPELPRDIVEARTGIPVIDGAVRELYETGYLHNHARMWLASYVVHIRKVHWRAGADWMYGYLLDGDLASNYLSWQWVAATFSSKPYVFNADNVARYAPLWASPKTAIDVSYETLDLIAHGGQAVAAEWGSETIKPYEVPPLFAMPPQDGILPNAAPDLAFGDTKEVVNIRLIHPWDLAEPLLAPSDAAAGVKKIGIIHAPFHSQFPWSEKRWTFVMSRMQAITNTIFIGDLNRLLPALRQANQAAECQATETYYSGYREALEAANILITPPRRFTQDPEKYYSSFTSFWTAIGRQKMRRKRHR